MVETWITRFVASLCGLGGLGLLWTFGVFVAVLWHEGCLLDLNRSEWQAIGVPLLLGIAVAWGALYLFGIADREKNPRIYKTTRAIFLIACVVAAISGIVWANHRIG